MTTSEFHTMIVDRICVFGANEDNFRDASERDFASSKDNALDDLSQLSINCETFLKKESAKALTCPESLSLCEPMVDCFSNTEECAGSHMFSGFSSGENSDQVRGQIYDVLDCVHYKNRISDRSSSEIKHGIDPSYNIEKKIISDHTGKHSFGCISHMSSCNNDVMCCNNGLENLVGPKESSSCGSIYRTKSSNECSRISDSHEMISGRTAEHGRKLSESSNGVAYMRNRAKRFNQAGKENGHYVWQKKVQKNVRNECIQEGKQSDHDHVQMGIGTQEAAVLVNHNSLFTGPLQSSPAISSFRQSCFTEAVKGLRNDEKGYQNNGCHVMVESPQWVAQERFHGNVGQHLLQSKQDGIQKDKVQEKSKAKPYQSLRHGNFNHLKRRSWANKETFSRIGNKKNLSGAESLESSSTRHLCVSTRTDFGCLPLNPVSSARLQQNVPYPRIVGPSDNSLLHGVGPSTWMNIARTHASSGSLRVYSDDEEKGFTFYEIELSYEDDVKKDFASQFSLQRWIPVGRKDSSTLRNSSIVDKPILGSRKSEIPSLNPGSAFKNSSTKNERNLSHDIPAKRRSESEILESDKLGNQGSCKEMSRKEYVQSDSATMNISLLHGGSQKSEEVLTELFRLQLASDSVQSVTGSPLAEFERLLHSASPVIIPASVPKLCEECTGNQIFLQSLCRHHVPNIPLSDIWDWYEKPASYGLEVKVEDSECPNVMDTRGISFHAYFVPFLSAVQLFGHSCDPKFTSEVSLISEVPKENQRAKQCPNATSPNIRCVEVAWAKPLESSVPILLDSAKNLTKSSDLLESDSHASSNDIELIFEFFESEQPQQRKPLYDKIMELIKSDSSCHHVYGDPSKLKCLNLQDLHPASWYSVAWYPIYRIPEGNLRASFLTYHSLGYLSQRCFSATDSLGKKAFCVVCPTVGLQSYNTHGECWFYAKKHSHVCSKETMALNASAILEERLRTLEEAALLFARGYVYKDNIKVANHQPDYEFFLSRKR